MKKEKSITLSIVQAAFMEIIQKRLQNKPEPKEAFFSNKYFQDIVYKKTMGGKAYPAMINRNLSALEEKGFIKVTLEKPNKKHGGLDRRIRLIMSTSECDCKVE